MCACVREKKEREREGEGDADFLCPPLELQVPDHLESGDFTACCPSEAHQTYSHVTLLISSVHTDTKI